jgi:hypothetical protein
MSDTRSHPRPESAPATTQYERYVRRLEEELARDGAKGSASRAVGYRRPRHYEEPEPTIQTEYPTRVYRAHTEVSPGSGRLVVRIIDETGRPDKAIRCKTISQCREVVRVETPLYEPGALFFIADGLTPVESWAVGKDGLPKRGRVR